MAKIYLAYKQSDQTLARDMAQALQGFGHEVLYDEAVIEAGQNWREVMMRALAGSDAVVVLLSEAALRSPFVMGEIGATRALQFVEHGRQVLLPLRIGSIGLPPVVNDLQVIDLEPTPAGVLSTAGQVHEAVTRHLAALSAKRGPKIFVSHRHSDVAVVQALIQVLETAFDIRPQDLRCTSVAPYRLKVGQNTGQRLRSELQNAEVVLGIVSPDAKASSYVLMELGASWGRSGITLPLLVRGATAADVPSPLVELHALSLSQVAECRQLVEDLADVVTLPRRSGNDALLDQRLLALASAAAV